jgi:hypothetical protein
MAALLLAQNALNGMGKDIFKAIMLIMCYSDSFTSLFILKELEKDDWSQNLAFTLPVNW